MANMEHFALNIKYGGRFEVTHKGMRYVGGNSEEKRGLDTDRFGYLDLVDLVEKLGYISWDKLWYRIPQTNEYKEMVDDKGVMELLSYVGNLRLFSVFIDGGKTLDEFTDKIAHETHPQMENERGGQSNGEGDSEANGDEDDEFESSSEGIGEEKLHKESYAMDAGEQALADFEINSESSDEEDINFNPSESEGSEVSLQDLDFVDPEEYIEAKQKLSAHKISNVFDVIDRDDGFEITTDETNESEYDGSDLDGDLSETDEDQEGPKLKKHRTVYDPKCNHSTLEIVLGMHFQDGFQCKDALTSWAIEHGKFIRFRQVSKKKLIAKCKPSMKSKKVAHLNKFKRPRTDSQASCSEVADSTITGMEDGQ